MKYKHIYQNYMQHFMLLFVSKIATVGKRLLVLVFAILDNYRDFQNAHCSVHFTNFAHCGNKDWSL